MLFQINDLLDKIVHQFDENLADVSWMDGTTRDKARDKLAAVGRKIGYPDYIRDPEQLDEHYEKVKRKCNNYINSLEKQ